MKFSWKETQRRVYNNMVWLLIIFSLILFSLSKINVFVFEAEELLEKASFAILSSGVFAAVLKSIQFTGIFKSEIEEIILGTDFIENRSESNQQQLWKATSKAIYKKKFPELSGFIEGRILGTYLPTNKDFYYRDYVITINIEEINKNFDISYTQTSKFEVVLDESISETELMSSLTISQDEDNDDTYKNEVVFYTIDGVEAKTNTSLSEDNTKSITTVPIGSQNGKKVFKVHKKIRRKYSLKNENYKLIRMVTFTKGIDVVVSFPENVSVSFFNIGNVQFFEAEHVEVKNQLCRSHKNDVILPYQGFGMSFELNN